MLTRITFLLASLLSFGCAASDCESRNPHSYHSKFDATKINNSTVVLVQESIEKINVAYCSGVWIGDKKIITAAHCVSKESEIRFETYKDYLVGNDVFFEAYHTAKIIKINKKIDLALLETNDKPDHDTAEISSNKINIRDDVTIVGHSGGIMYTVSKGNVSGIRPMIDIDHEIDKMIQVSGAVWKGNSGGGAFNEDGELIGLCSLISKTTPMVSFFVHKDVINNFLNSK